MNVVSIMQPGYFPWPGFFDLLYKSDLFVVYDSVRYTKATWRNRNRIRVDCKDGWKWLTVPVQSGAEEIPIHDVRIAGSAWQAKHLQQIQSSYAKAPYFAAMMDHFSNVFNKKWDFLVDLDMYILDIFLSILGGSGPRVVLSSSLNLAADGDKTEKLLEICRVTAADRLYDSAGAKAFFREDVFRAAGIGVQFQDYAPPTYPQVFSPFVPALSTLDMVMNCGPDSLAVIMGKEHAQRLQAK